MRKKTRSEIWFCLKNLRRGRRKRKRSAEDVSKSSKCSHKKPTCTFGTENHRQGCVIRISHRGLEHACGVSTLDAPCLPHFYQRHTDETFRRSSTHLCGRKANQTFRGNPFLYWDACVLVASFFKYFLKIEIIRPHTRARARAHTKTHARARARYSCLGLRL